MGRRIRMPLWVLLPCLAVCLAASGAVAIGVAGVSTAGSYLMRQADDTLRGCASNMLSHGLVAAPSSGPASARAMPGACGMELLSASGQMLIPAAPGTVGPAIPAGSWLAAHLARPVTVPGARSGGRWRVIIKAVHYQAQRILYVYGPDDVRYVISGRTGHGLSGMLIAMAQLTGTGQAAAGFAAAAGTVLVLLAAAAFALTQAVLRPLREAAELAGQGGGGRLEDAMGRLSVLANRDHGRCGMTLARMRERLHASRTAEAAARKSAADMQEQMEQTCLQLRRPVSILHGFTEYCREQERLPADLDRMLRRVTDEITRMETLVEGLRMLSAGESTVPDRRPDPPATDPTARDRLQNNRKPPASAGHATLPPPVRSSTIPPTRRGMGSPGAGGECGCRSSVTGRYLCGGDSTDWS
jgi:hypothetical protein